MNVTRHEKVNRIAEAGQNLCGNAFFSNAERIVSALESDSCRELNISFSVTVKASNKDELGIGKIEFENPSLVITNNHKYKDSFDDVVLDFVEPELPGINEDEDGKKKEKNVKGVVIDASRQLTTSEARQEFVYMDEKTGKTYFAGQGLGDDAFMTFKGLPTDKSRHRYVNKALPVQKTIEDAETDLITLATKKGWKRVEYEVSQEKVQSENDPMNTKKTLTEIHAPCGEELEGCCQCEIGKCNIRMTKFGAASECLAARACSWECPRFIKDESDFELKPDETKDYTFRGEDPDLRCCDNAYKLFKLGYIALMLELDYKKISAWDNDAKCFRVKDEFKTQAAAKSEFEKLLGAAGEKYLDIAKFNTWKIGNAAKRFRGYEYDLAIRYQTEGGGWGSPEKFNTEVQYKNRLQELREKLDHFEV
jgi:hypothetical protein